MYPQRLPIVDSDDGTWGDIIRKYLSKEHYNDDSDNPENGGHKNVTIRAGTAGAGGAPLKFTSGTLLTAPEAGAVEFNTDKLYFTKTTGPTRQTVATYDVTGSTGDMYYRDSSSNFTRLAIGSANQILTVAGSPAVPTWTTSTAYSAGGTDVAVADGGTGRSTGGTAYGIIAAGTTATGTQQTISPGTSGQFLKSAGASALASFANITAADITGTTAQFNTALTDNDFATIAGAETLTNKTLTTPKIGTALLDSNGNQILGFIAAASAVNYVVASNNVASGGPSLSAYGTDTNINLYLNPKGSGGLKVYAATGQTPNIGADGVDANIDLNLTSKGTGTVKMNGAAIAADSSVVKLTGNQTIAGTKTFSSSINLSTNRILSVGDPTGAQDAATKNYVDSKVTRITKSSNNSTGSTIYIKLATMPVDDAGNFATLNISGRIGGWVGVENVATWNILISNRSSSLGGTEISGAVYGQGKTQSAVGFTDVVVYTQPDKSAIVYFAIPNNQYYTFDVHVDVFQATIDYTGATVSPTGTVRWKLSENSQVTSQNGQLYMANNDPTVGGDTSFTAISAYNNSGARFGSSFDGSATPYAYVNLTDGNGITTQTLMTLSASLFDMKSHRLANVVNPVNAQDAATKNYVDTNAITPSGAATLTNKTINLNGGGNIITGVPYDLSVLAFGTYTARAANSYGDFPMGIKLQRAVTFTQVVYRVNSADASGNLTVELRKNGTTISGSSATIAAANQVSGGTATGTWPLATGDILTVYVTGVGTSPGAGLIADIRGYTS